MYQQILTANIKENVWKSLRRIKISISLQKGPTTINPTDHSYHVSTRTKPKQTHAQTKLDVLQKVIEKMYFFNQTKILNKFKSFIFERNLTHKQQQQHQFMSIPSYRWCNHSKISEQK